MTQRLLIIGGGIQGILSASAAATSGVRSELMLSEHALGPMGASLYSAGVHLPHGRRNRTRSLTRKCAVALAAMAASTVSGGFRPIAMRVVSGPGEVSDRDQLREPQDPAWPRMGSLAPNFCGQYPFWSIDGLDGADVPALIARPERELVANVRAAHGLRRVKRTKGLLIGQSHHQQHAPAVTPMQTYRIDKSLRAWTIAPSRRGNKALKSTRSGMHLASPPTCRGVPSPWATPWPAPDCCP